MLLERGAQQFGGARRRRRRARLRRNAEGGERVAAAELRRGVVDERAERGGDEADLIITLNITLTITLNPKT